MLTNKATHSTKNFSSEMLTSILLLISIPHPTLAQYELFSKREDDGLFNIFDPVLEDIRPEFRDSKLVETPVECGIRNGYYFNRVVGGHTAEPGEFPWQVSIQVKLPTGYKHVCGGAIVHQQWIISAGHCVYDVEPTVMSVVAGDYNLYEIEGFEQRRRVNQTFTHNFDVTNFEHDISLIRLLHPLVFKNVSIAPICIPNTQDVFEDFGTVCGWGRLGENRADTDVLRHVSLPIIKKSICDVQYKNIGFSRFLNECQLCAGYPRGRRDACQGDSGGPLICRKDDRYYLCGIVSWGLGCARPSYPGIYTRVTCFTNWIKNILKTK